jgi:DNA-binding NtrC family response regulator
MRTRLAVLDDEQRMVDIIGMVLRREGHEVHTFTEAETALAALEKQSFDLLITDLKMPTLDGVEVLERARRIDAELPVILITAHASVPTALKAMRSGAFDYVEKPFDNTELKALVRRDAPLPREPLPPRRDREPLLPRRRGVRERRDARRARARAPLGA